MTIETAAANTTTTRRRFLTYFSAIGLSSTLLPGVLWGKMQDDPEQHITLQMLKDALAVAGLEFTDEQEQKMLDGVNRTLKSYEALRELHIPGDIQPPMYFSPIVPGTKLDRIPRPFRTSTVAPVRRPANLDDVAFWSVAQLAHLIQSRQVTSVELTQMYLARLRRFNSVLNCVVTYTDDLAMQQARNADREIAAGTYRGPLHGIPWGCKDIITVPQYPTQWGSGAFRGQVLTDEATVVRLLRDAGAVLIAKLASGELASGDQWFGGRTNNPWDPSEGSSGSSAGPASATAGGLVAFGIGTETSGSILSPSSRCGATGLRPTFGRVSRHGAMTLSWTQDRLGPICRTVEDCALVMHAIAKPDEQDLSVIDLPFNWDATRDVRTLRVGYPAAAFHEEGRNPDWQKNDQRVLDQLRAMGVKLEPFELPEFPMDTMSGLGGAEAGAFFDEFVRTGPTDKLTNPDRATSWRRGRLVPAVEYLQRQRARAMLMQRFAAVVSQFDAYVAPYIDGRASQSEKQPASMPILDHFQFANIGGYPAISVLNGFTSDGKTTSITFLAPVYGETDMLTLAKAYQDQSGLMDRHPKL